MSFCSKQASDETKAKGHFESRIDMEYAYYLLEMTRV